jgi:hypothetical protein
MLKYQEVGMNIEDGPVLVRGASGGVGTLAVLMLNELGYKELFQVFQLLNRQYNQLCHISLILLMLKYQEA